MTFIDIRWLKVQEPRPGWRGRFFHSENMTFAYYKLAAGLTLADHAHPNDEVWNVIEGELEVTVAGKSQVLGPGCIAVIPPHAVHSIAVLTDARAIVVDHPRRASIGAVTLE